MIWGVQLFSETSDIVVCEGFFVLWCRCLMFKLKGRVISHQWPVSSTASFVTTFMTATACIVVTIFDMEYGDIYIYVYINRNHQQKTTYSSKKYPSHFCWRSLISTGLKNLRLESIAVPSPESSPAMQFGGSNETCRRGCWFFGDDFFLG